MSFDELLQKIEKFYYRVNSCVGINYSQLQSEYDNLNKLCYTSGFKISDLYLMCSDNELHLNQFTKPFTNKVLCRELYNQQLLYNKSNVRRLSFCKSKNRSGDSSISPLEFIKASSEVIYSAIHAASKHYHNGELNSFKESFVQCLNDEKICKLESLALSDIQSVLMGKNIGCDKEILDCIAELYIKFFDFRTEHCGCIYKDKALFRIYINTPYNIETLKFLKDYAIECMKNDINFDMKAFDKVNGSSNNDRLILYVNYENLSNVISILNLLAFEHPKFINSLGVVLPHCAKVDDSYYGICHCGAFRTSKDKKSLYTNVATYNDYIDMISNASFNRLKAYIITRYFPDDLDVRSRDALKTFINFENFKISSDDIEFPNNVVTESLFGLYKYNEICDIISKHDDAVMNYLRGINNKDTRFNVFCDFFSDGLQKFHNLLQGFPLADESNIAIDTFYIRNVSSKDNNISFK